MRLVEATMHASGQLAVRLAILLLGGLFVLAGSLGLDVVLGAFSAGMIVGLIAAARPRTRSTPSSTASAMAS